jgi:hypothetical protein
VKVFIILVVATDGEAIVAVVKDILVNAGDVASGDTCVTKELEVKDRSALISSDVVELLKIVHRILATVPFLKSAIGARLFSTFVTM